jgi:hypothetical protein
MLTILALHCDSELRLLENNEKNVKNVRANLLI